MLKPHCTKHKTTAPNLSLMQLLKQACSNANSTTTQNQFWRQLEARL